MGTMNWVFFAALIVASAAAKLDRTYLPPASAATAGGSPGSLQTPFAKSDLQNLPLGSFVNEHDGVVIDVASAGTRAAQSGLGAERIAYGSMDSKVGEAAFRGTNQANDPILDYNPDLSAFNQPMKPMRSESQFLRDRGASIVRYHNENNGESYSYGYETDNGIKAEENGVATNGVQAEGGFSYVGDDGKVYSVVYTADEGGYRPMGSHLPTPPPIPVEILKSLEQNSRDEAAGIFEDGSYDPQKYNSHYYTKPEVNNKYGNSQINKFNFQPGLGGFNGGFMNNNPAISIRPNLTPLFGTKPETSKFPTVNNFGANLNKGNGLGNSQANQISLDAQLGSGNQYSQKQNAQDSFSSNLESSPMNTNNISSIVSAKPLSQQALQETMNEQGQSGNPRPSSYDTSLSSVISENVSSKDDQQQISKIESNQNKPSTNDQSFLTPIQRLPTYNINKNMGPKYMQSNPDGNEQNLSGNPLGTYTVNNQLTQTTRVPDFSLQSGISSTSGLDNTRPSSETINRDHLFTPLRPVISNKEPERTLTTPFEAISTANENKQSSLSLTQAQYSGSNFANMGDTTLTEFTSDFSAKPFSQTENVNSKTTPSQFMSTSGNKNDAKVTNPLNLSSGNFFTQTQQYEANKNNFEKVPSITSTRPHNFNFSQSTQIPSSTQFNRQTQDPTNSYIYNKPLKPFNSAFIRPENNNQKFPTTVSYQLNKDVKQTDFNTDRNTEMSSTAFSDTTNSFNTQKYFTPSVQTIVFENKGSFPSIGITQASASSFPSISPPMSTFESSGKFSSKPIVQQTTQNYYTPVQSFKQNKFIATTVSESASTAQNIGEENSSQTQQYETNIYEYNKPSQSLPSNNEKLENQQESQLTTKFGTATQFKGQDIESSKRKEQISFGNGNQKDFDKKTTPSLLQQTTLEVEDKLTTVGMQSPSDITDEYTQKSDPKTTSQFEVYEYTKPSQILTSSRKEQFGTNIPTSQFNELSDKKPITSFTGSYTETMDSFQTEPQLTTQFDQSEFEKKTEMPEFSQTSTFNDMPTIYQYTKPAQFISTTQQKNNNNMPLSQSEQTTETTISTQIGEKFFGGNNFGMKILQNGFNSKQMTSFQFTQGSRQTITPLFNKLTTPSVSQQTLGDKINVQNKVNNGEIYDYQKPNQTFGSSHQMKVNFNQKPSSVFGSFVLPQDKPESKPQSGEIYEYSKPAQVLTTPSQNNILNQIGNQQFGQRLNKVDSQRTTFNPNQDDEKLTTQNDEFMTTSMVTQTDYQEDKITQTDSTAVTSQDSLTTGISSSLNTRPRLSFYSACCRGLQTRKQQGSGSTQSTANTKIASERKTVSDQNYETQKLTTQAFKQRENFGGPRKPPSFDDKGYHY